MGKFTLKRLRYKLKKLKYLRRQPLSYTCLEGKLYVIAVVTGTISKASESWSGGLLHDRQHELVNVGDLVCDLASRKCSC